MSVQRLFELSVDMLCIADKEGYFRIINPAFTNTLGFTPAQLLAEPFIEFVHQDDRPATLNAVAALNAGEPVIDFVNRYRCADGSYRTLSWRALQDSGEIHAVARDITRQHAEHKSLEEFIYITSHDLREPLTGIAGYADLVRKRYADKLDERGQHFLNSIVEQSKRLEAKIDDLLYLSRAGRGKPNGMFPLGSAIDEAQRSLAAQIRDSNAVIEVVGEAPMVRGNRSEIAQVFQNLFSNAIKYKKPGTTPHIRVSAHTTPSGWEIHVTDEGIGFDMAYADRIWGVFQRLYTIDQYPGTGIGLAIVKKIVDKHGGRAWALSEPNVGSTFYFTLPATTPQRLETSST